MNSLYTFMLFLTGVELVTMSVSGYDNLLTLLLLFTLFVLYFVFVFFLLQSTNNIVRNADKTIIKGVVLLKAFSFTSVFMLAYYLSDGRGSLFPSDAELIHIPQILAITDMIVNGSNLPYLRENTIFGTYYFSNYYFSVLYILTGNFELAVIIGLALLLLANISFIYMNCNLYFRDDSAGKIALLVIFISQSFFFYSLQLYKEGFFYFFVNVFIYSVLKRNYILLIICFYIISHERFYAAIIFAIAAAVTAIIHSKKEVRIALIFMFLLSSLLLVRYTNLVEYLTGMSVALSGFRANHLISDAGNSLPFPLTILQISLSPIPNLFKVENWIYQDRLLIVSFCFSFVVLIATIKLIFKHKDLFLCWCCYSYVGYLFLWSWVAPFNGRARDGVFPILVIIVCAGFFNLRKKDLLKNE